MSINIAVTEMDGVVSIHLTGRESVQEVREWLHPTASDTRAPQATTDLRWEVELWLRERDPRCRRCIAMLG